MTNDICPLCLDEKYLELKEVNNALKENIRILEENAGLDYDLNNELKKENSILQRKLQRAIKQRDIYIDESLCGEWGTVPQSKVDKIIKSLNKQLEDIK